MDEPVRVLHVDDEPDFADLTSTFLERESDQFTVETATDASDALDRIDHNEYDCIVSDFDMRGTNGIGFLKAVREKYPDLPFILFTGKGSEELASDAISAGVTDYLQKEGGTSQYTVLANRIENAVARYRAEQQLAIQKDQYKRLFERAPVMYVVTGVRDGAPIVEDCNQEFLDRLGYGRDEVIDELLERFYTPESREAMLDGGGFDRTLSGELITEEREFVSSDGDVVETLIRAVPRFNEDGVIVGTLALYVDITERKERERELERQNERLEEFAGIVSHDLRNPLQVARGRLELAQSECDSDHLGYAVTALDRIETLIDDLLTMASEGEHVDDPAVVSLSGAVDSAWDTVDTAGATLRVESDCTVHADRSRLQQLLENLFRNSVEHGSTSPDSQARQDAVEHSSTSSRPGADDAVEHGSTSPDSQARQDAGRASSSEPSVADAPEDAVEHRGGNGEREVTITVGALAGENGFYVEDDGPGIPEDDREQVFESGYSTVADGTGFGLSIVRTIADAHGWEIRVTESETGGARFEIAGT